MILVTVGTNEAPFDRLLRILDGHLYDADLVVQHGPSAVRPAGAVCVEFLPYDELVAVMQRADLVVTHAGVGTIMTALASGRRPVVFPRLARYAEAVDDHQVALARRLDAEGLVIAAETEDDLLAAIDRPPSAAAHELGASRRLVADLRDFVASSCG